MNKKRIVLTSHAFRQLKERGISLLMVKRVLSDSSQIVRTHSHRKIAQRITIIDKKPFLIRVVFEETAILLRVVTVYLTTKILKYGGEA